MDKVRKREYFDKYEFKLTRTFLYRDLSSRTVIMVERVTRMYYSSIKTVMLRLGMTRPTFISMLQNASYSFIYFLRGDNFRRTATSFSEESTAENQFVCVHYYGLEDLRDNVDRTIGCIKLKWARTTGRHPWYDITPDCSIR